MKLIPLTQGQFAIVDDHWYDYLMQWSWFAHWDEHSQGYYAKRTEYRPCQRTVSMHRVVAQTPEGMICDHIHHKTLDNREEELRNVTPSQSNINRRIQKNNHTGIPGVRVPSRGPGFMANLTYRGKVVLNKTFKTIEEATQARKEAEKKYFGEFAKK